jgi:hypothetical protein
MPRHRRDPAHRRRARRWGCRPGCRPATPWRTRLSGPLQVALRARHIWPRPGTPHSPCAHAPGGLLAWVGTWLLARTQIRNRKHDAQNPARCRVLRLCWISIEYYVVNTSPASLEEERSGAIKTARCLRWISSPSTRLALQPRRKPELALRAGHDRPRLHCATRVLRVTVTCGHLTPSRATNLAATTVRSPGSMHRAPPSGGGGPSGVVRLSILFAAGR